MKYDLSQPISQRGSGEETPQNRRIRQVADELCGRCELYEAQFRDGEKDVNHLDIEQRVAEQYAKENGIWLSIDKVFDLGTPGPCGNENDTYVKDDMIYKVNNLLNCGSILCLFDKLLWHNDLFYDTAYSFYAFTGFDGRTVMPVFVQRLVKNAQPATPIEIETYMAAIGFTKKNNEGRFTNNMYEVWDLVPRNVLKDNDGDIYVVDAEIKGEIKGL